MSGFVIVAVVVLTIAGLLGVYRAFRGPTHLDRVLALDYLSLVGLGVFILMVYTTKQAVVFDVGICLALVGFLTAYFFAKYIGEVGAQEEGDS
jgi:multicomponent Na+:H+ antiporter subunit F